MIKLRIYTVLLFCFWVFQGCSDANEHNSNSGNINTEKIIIEGQPDSIKTDHRQDLLEEEEIIDPYGTIKRIFDSCNEFEESTDSPRNIDSLKYALSLIKRDENLMQDSQLVILLVDVWMYYTVTDFDTRRYIEDVLKNYPEQWSVAI